MMHPVRDMDRRIPFESRCEMAFAIEMFPREEPLRALERRAQSARFSGNMERAQKALQDWKEAAQ
jgi:hypothetical protein